MELPEGLVGIDVGKQLRMKPFGKLLDRHELVRHTVELVPGGMNLAILSPLRGLEKAGRCIKAASLLRALAASAPRPTLNELVDVGFGCPVGARDDHMVGIADDDLLGFEIAKGSFQHVVQPMLWPPACLHHLAEICGARRYGSRHIVSGIRESAR